MVFIINYLIEKMQLVHALEIVKWEYPEPYHVYNMEGSALAIAELMGGQYFTVCKDHKLVGFFCFGPSAQIRSPKGKPLYSDTDLLDVGLGMHPAYCGQGYGQGFVQAGLMFAIEKFWIGGFRLTVDAVNWRAQKVYKRLGFVPIGSFSAMRRPCTFIVMVMKLGV